MAGYTKLFASLIHSTVWREDNHVRLVWITMLAIADRDGIVEAAVPGLADAARVKLEECLDALEKLKAPDEYSRTRDHEGRRVEEIDGGWVILNYQRYREKLTLDQIRLKQAERQRKYRERKKLTEPEAKPETPDDWNGSPDETICPADLASRAEKILPEMVTRLPGSTLEQLRASANRCVAHYTIGRGMGQRRRHWMKVLRGWVTKDHGDNNLKNGGKKTDLQQILERNARIQAESKS